MNDTPQNFTPSERTHRFGEDIGFAEFDPIFSVKLFFRGRMRKLAMMAAVISPVLAFVGFQGGTKLYDSQAILRVYPQEKSIMFDSGDSSVLKTFDSYVKAETTYVASYPVMEKAMIILHDRFPALTEEMNEDDLAGSIEISRKESLIVLTTKSKNADFAQAKLDAVTNSYLALHRDSRLSRSQLRIQELERREGELMADLQAVDNETLRVGGEYDLQSLAKAHMEKIAQIDRLSVRRGEVEQTLSTMMERDGNATADTNDKEILRATLLDRALADLNFTKFHKEEELARLVAGLKHPEKSRLVALKQLELDAVKRAMQERRDQIQVLGQTGALTAMDNTNAEASVQDVRDLVAKVTTQLEAAKSEARDLNAKRIDLIRLDEERDQVREMLDETRKVLDMVRVENGKMLPSLSVLMSPATYSSEPAEDSAKILAAGGFAGGGVLALIILIVGAKIRGGVRFTDDMWRTQHMFKFTRAITKRQMQNEATRSRAFDALRNAIMLFPARMERIVGQGRVILVTRADGGDATVEAQELAQAFRRARLNTLLIDADPRKSALSHEIHTADLGFFDDIEGDAQPTPVTGPEGLDIVVATVGERAQESDVNLRSLRRRIVALGKGRDVLVVHAGSLKDTQPANLLLASCEICLAVAHPRDSAGAIENVAQEIHQLPKNGGAMLLSYARDDDTHLLC